MMVIEEYIKSVKTDNASNTHTMEKVDDNNNINGTVSPVLMAAT